MYAKSLHNFTARAHTFMRAAYSRTHRNSTNKNVNLVVLVRKAPMQTLACDSSVDLFFDDQLVMCVYNWHHGRPSVLHTHWREYWPLISSRMSAPNEWKRETKSQNIIVFYIQIASEIWLLQDLFRFLIIFFVKATTWKHYSTPSDAINLDWWIIESTSRIVGVLGAIGEPWIIWIAGNATWTRLQYTPARFRFPIL